MQSDNRIRKRKGVCCSEKSETSWRNPQGSSNQEIRVGFHKETKKRESQKRLRCQTWYHPLPQPGKNFTDIIFMSLYNAGYIEI